MTSHTAPRPALEQSALQQAAGPDWEVRLEEEVDSTNALAVSAARRGLVVVAEHQSAGRGRLDRSWEAPPRTSLTFSATVEPGVEPRLWPLIPLVTGLAVARAIGPEARLKWPNDVLLGGKKACGILVERVEATPPLAVIGIGINVSQAAEELPVPEATSLALAGIDLDRATLLGQVLAQLRPALGQLAQHRGALLDQYRGLSATLGQQVRVHLPDGSTLEGLVDDIDGDGRLVVGGRAVAAGDVIHVRPAG